MRPWLGPENTWGEITDFRNQCNVILEEAMIGDELKREAKWTEAIAVGERAYVEAIERQIRGRQELSLEEQSGSWVLRGDYSQLFSPEKSPMHPLAGSILL